jgi:hypothetical protein
VECQSAAVARGLPLQKVRLLLVLEVCYCIISVCCWCKRCAAMECKSAAVARGLLLQNVSMLLVLEV